MKQEIFHPPPNYTYWPSYRAMMREEDVAVSPTRKLLNAREAMEMGYPTVLDRTLGKGNDLPEPQLDPAFQEHGWEPMLRAHGRLFKSPEEDYLTYIRRLDDIAHSTRPKWLRRVDNALRAVGDFPEASSKLGHDAAADAAEWVLRKAGIYNQTVTGIARESAGFVGGLAADPTTYLLAGAGTIARGIGKRLMVRGFQVYAGYGVLNQSKQLLDAWRRDDIPYEQKVEMATGIVLNSALAGFMQRHGHESGKLPIERQLLDTVHGLGKWAAQDILSRSLEKFNGAVAQRIGEILNKRESTPQPNPGEQVILRNGERGEIVSLVPNLNRIVLRTRSGLKTVTAADIRTQEPQRTGHQNSQDSGLTTGSQIGPIQFKAGDYVESLKDGRDGIVERILPRLGLAQVRTGSGKLQAVRLSKLAHRLVSQTGEWEAATYDVLPIRKGQPTQQEAAILGKAPRRPAQGTGESRDFQIKTCGPMETLIQGGGEIVWADGLEMSDGVARDAKYVRKVKRSMYVEGSRIDPEFRDVLEQRTVKEFRRYAAVIQDPKSPIRALEVIVSDRASVSYFLKLMKRFGISGHIVIK